VTRDVIRHVLCYVINLRRVPGYVFKPWYKLCHVLSIRYISGYVLNPRHILGYVLSLRHTSQTDNC